MPGWPHGRHYDEIVKLLNGLHTCFNIHERRCCLQPPRDPFPIPHPFSAVQPDPVGHPAPGRPVPGIRIPVTPLPEPIGGDEGVGYILCGAVVVVATICEDFGTCGGGIADDPVTIGFGCTMIRAGLGW